MSQDDDEDWFEQALREDEDAKAASGGSGADAAAEGGAAGGGGAGDGANDGDSLFEQDFASALGSAPGGDIDGGGEFGTGEEMGGGGGGMGGGGGGMGGGGGGMSGGGGGMSGGGGGMGGGGGGMGGMGSGGGEFGMGGEMGGGGMGAGMGMGGGSERDFSDEEIDSALPRINLGIDGLDDMIQGGVPARSLMVTVGSAGTGKTTFGLQFVNEALENGEKAVYITLEESKERVLNTATEKGWAWDEYDQNGQLAVVDIDPVEMANSLQSIQSELPRLIQAFNASRLVLDSVSLLEMMYEDRATRRNEIWDFTKSLKDAGVTTMMTSEASDSTPYASRHGIVEYLSDAVFILQYVRPDDFHETRMAIEIQKIRDANHSRDKKPYELTDTGISVHQQANIF